MILKASQRGNGQELAFHLQRLDQNEHMELHELRGFASDNLSGAFKEAEAISRASKCQQYLFSVSLNPPQGESVGVEVFEDALERIEKRLGLEDQPRAVVFHEKENRRHMHCVWSRMDDETLTARQLSFFKTKLMGISRDLYLENGWKLPDGLRNAAERNPTNFSLAEWQQAKRQDIDPRWLKQTMQESWASSDNARSFGAALEEKGFFLARGDRRGFVILDHSGEVYSLPRMLGMKTKDVRARLGDGTDLPSVTDTKTTIGERMSPAIERHVEDSRMQFSERQGKLNNYKKDMTQLHRAARQKLVQRQKKHWRTETKTRAARLPKGLRGIWHRITGKYQKISKQNETEASRTRKRNAHERQKMIEEQHKQRAVLQKQIKNLRKKQADQLVELRKEFGRFMKFKRGDGGIARTRRRGLQLKLQR